MLEQWLLEQALVPIHYQQKEMLINIIRNAWSAIDKLSIIWKSDLSDKIKWEFFIDVIVSLQLYGYIIWTLTKHLKKSRWELDKDAVCCSEEILEAAIVVFWLSTQPKMPFQGDAPEGGDTFWWQLWEEIAWAEIGWWNGTK